MSRYSRQEIPQGQEAWVDAVNENFENVFDNPLPPANYSAPANLPNAAEYVDSLAIAGGNMYLSDGVSWNLINQAGGGMTLLNDEDLTGLVSKDIPHQSEWDTYGALVAKVADFNTDILAKVGISAYYDDPKVYFDIQQWSNSTGRYLVQFNADLSITQQNNFAVKISNRLSMYKGVETFEAGCFGTSNSTMAVESRSNPEVLNSSFANITTEDDHCVIMHTNNGVSAEAFGGFTVSTEAGALFTEGRFQIWGI